MGCGCSKGTAAQAVRYTYTDPNGKVVKNLSETQARAMQIRKGGGTYAAKPQ